MNNNRNNILFELDWVSIFLYISLISMGWISIYITSYSTEIDGIFNLSTYYGKQLFFIALSFVIIILILSIEASFYERFAIVFYIISILFLIGLFFFGKTINGQTAWYSFGSFGLQPAEFVKTTTGLTIAKLLSDNLFDIKKISDFKNVLIILSIPFVLIMLQPDFGSAIIYFAFIFVLLREGLSSQIFIGLIIFISVFIGTIKYGMTSTLTLIFLLLSILSLYAYKKQSLFFRRNWLYLITTIITLSILVLGSNFVHKKVLKPHHKDRLALWLRMENDSKKIQRLKKTYGFNNDQSIKTIASGGLIGKGFLEGDRTNGNFVPEQHTDYIFSGIGEEFGFVGSSIVIILFMLLILRIIYKAEHQKSKFARIYGYSVAGFLFVHFTINIGMVLDLLPTVGIPLPFFSYGGSSLWGFTILLFIFLKLDANQKNVF